MIILTQQRIVYWLLLKGDILDCSLNIKDMLNNYYILFLIRFLGGGWHRYIGKCYVYMATNMKVIDVENANVTISNFD